MNDRSTALILIAVALAGYGVYIAGYVPAMLLGQPVGRRRGGRPAFGGRSRQKSSGNEDASEYR